MLALLYMPGIGIRGVARAVAEHGTAEHAARALAPRISPTVQARVDRARRVIDALQVRVFCIDDDVYPENLRHVDEPPYVLFARGRLELLGERKRLAVVGSRDCTEYGIETTQLLTRPVARAGVVVVSGLARGIDGTAHAAALDAGGDTIAVLGNGIDRYYPACNRQLQETIARDGLLLTEFPPGTHALPYHFPHRNRIIAFLCQAVLVVEARAGGGSLSTAARARQSFDVLAVPGPIGRDTSVGTNALIRDGARIVTAPEDVLEALHVPLRRAPNPESVAPLDLEGDARLVWHALGAEPRHVDEVAARVGLSRAVVALSLLQLELAGCARQLAGSRFARVRGLR